MCAVGWVRALPSCCKRLIVSSYMGGKGKRGGREVT